MKVQPSLGKQHGRLEHHHRLPDLPAHDPGLLGALQASPSTQDQDEVDFFPSEGISSVTIRYKVSLMEDGQEVEQSYIEKDSLAGFKAACLEF